MKEELIQHLINCAEFGDDIDPNDLWRIIGENPADHLSEDGLKSLEMY